MLLVLVLLLVLALVLILVPATGALPLGDGTGDDARLDGEDVLAALDTEIPLLPPLHVPRVLDRPVVKPRCGVRAPTDDLNHGFIGAGAWVYWGLLGFIEEGVHHESVSMIAWDC